MVTIMDEFERVMQNPDHVIMSDGLSDLLQHQESYLQILSIDNQPFTCEVRKAKKYFPKNRSWNSDPEWEFEIFVSGLTFSQVIDTQKITLQIDDLNFQASSSFELVKDSDSYLIIFTARRIVNSDE